MTESQTRKYWRARLTAFLVDSDWLRKEGLPPDIEGWLDDWMQTPELSLAEAAETKPEHKKGLLTIDDGPFISVPRHGTIGLPRIVRLAE